MPRPTRMRLFLAPWLSEISLSFMMMRSSIDDAHEVLHLRDHAAHRRGVGKSRTAIHLVEPKAHQRRALAGVTADRATGLFDRHGLVSHRSLLRRRRQRRPRRRGGTEGR